MSFDLDSPYQLNDFFGRVWFFLLCFTLRGRGLPFIQRDVVGRAHYVLCHCFLFLGQFSFNFIFAWPPAACAFDLSFMLLGHLYLEHYWVSIFFIGSIFWTFQLGRHFLKHLPLPLSLKAERGGGGDRRWMCGN